MPRIYVSHRPQDSSHNDIPIILDLLHDKFGAENIFDTNNAIQTIKEHQILVKSCDVLLIVVGRFWRSMYDEEGYNMLFDPYDPVNIEINTGLSTSMVISTVVVDDVDMPSLDELPETMHDLHKKRIRLSNDETLEKVVTKLMKAWEHIESGTMAKEHGIDLQTMQMEQNEQQLSENPISTSEHNTITYIYRHVAPRVEGGVHQLANTKFVKNFKTAVRWSYAQIRNNWIISVIYLITIGTLSLLIVTYILFPHLFVYT